MNDYIVQVFKKSDKYPDHAYLVCELRMNGPLPLNNKNFAKQHGGDYIVILSIEEFEEDNGDLNSLY